MDYIVGSVAALVSGNVTPNRPKFLKRALTPTKHQPSPNVTPKSEFVDDRSIFLSPTLQKKKAIVKKSPKRIFQNPDLDLTDDGEGTSNVSPKADKVKKHLVEELEAAEMTKTCPKSPKAANSKFNKSVDAGSPKKKKKSSESKNTVDNVQVSSNENTPKKKKKQQNSVSVKPEIVSDKENVDGLENVAVTSNSPKKNKKRKLISDSSANMETEDINQASSNISPKKNKKRRQSVSEGQNTQIEIQNTEVADKTQNQEKKKKKKKRNKKPKTQINKSETPEATEIQETTVKKSKSQKKDKTIVNRNAITTEDTDSEHESDDEIESETEETNKEIFDTGPVESSDEEEEQKPQKEKKQEKKDDKERDVETEDEIKRTLFVGNVPFSKKCKKEIKKIFSKYGTIETVRIRTVPVKDARVTPKMAVITNELHPDRSTVNVYVKFDRQSSVAEALAENNTVLNDHHLRVTRSDSAGTPHDPKLSVFVGNLPFAIEDETLRSKFDKCGEILSVRIVRDRKTNAGKGFGYVNFASKDGVELALALSEEDLTIKNRIIRVKRCTVTDKRHGKFNKEGGNFQGGNQGGTQGGNQGFQGRNQGSFRGRNQSVQGRNQGGFQGRNQGGSDRGRSQGFQGRNQGGNDRGRSQGFRGRGQSGPRGGRGGSQGRSQGNAQRMAEGGQTGIQGEGAFRRIMKKRQNQESGEGQPKEKKARKEFVGMTAEKKKKQKPNKGNKKKRALSEILTKNKV